MHRDKVTRVLLLWVNNHFTDFETDPTMMEFLERFEAELESAKMQGEQISKSLSPSPLLAFQVNWECWTLRARQKPESAPWLWPGHPEMIPFRWEMVLGSTSNHDYIPITYILFSSTLLGDMRKDLGFLYPKLNQARRYNLLNEHLYSMNILQFSCF